MPYGGSKSAVSESEATGVSEASVIRQINWSELVLVIS